jgi:signal transduction histidine kinase
LAFRFRLPKKLPETLSLGPFTGLRARVVLAIAALTAVMVILFGVVVLRLLQHHLIVQKRAQGRTALLAMQAHFDLVEDVSAWRQRPDNTYLLNFVKAMANNLELRSLVIVDPGGGVIAHTRGEMVGLVLEEADLQRAVKERVLVHRVVGLDTEAPEIIFSGPLYQGGRIVGAARFSLLLDDLFVALAGTRRVLFLYALLDAIVIVLFGSLLLWRVLVKPVEQMVAATERMATGDYRVVLPTRGGSEIDRLGRALGKLAATLQDREAVAKRQMEKLALINKELKQAHDQLLHSDRLAYVGRVAAGVAHEIGNPLGAIYGYLEILREDLLTAEARNLLGRLEGEITRIDRIMRELLDFSRAKEPNPVDVNVPALAEEAVAVMKRQRGLDRVAIRMEPHDELPAVRLDPQHFRQTLLNVLLNAADAMGGEGSIALVAETAAFDRLQLMEPMLPGAPPESVVPFTDLQRRGIVFSEAGGPMQGTKVVNLHVTDSGPGMMPEVLAQIFNPFYTTKAAGRGTGLGLAVCQRLVASAGGLIRIESRPGAGTRVTLIYPVRE